MKEIYENVHQKVNTHLVSEQLADIQKTLKKSVFDQKEILNLTEAASFLCIAKSTLYKLTHKRLIPFHKPSGKIILFKRKELVEWIDSSKSYEINQLKSKTKEGYNGK